MSKFEVFCEKYISHFTHKLGEKKSVGVEKEILIVDKDGYMAQICDKVWPHMLKQGYRPIYDNFYKDQIVAFWDGKDQIALDAGRGTLELILDPITRVDGAERRLKELLQIVQPICEEEGLRMMSLAVQPKTKAARENWNRKQRYEILLDHLGEEVYAASLSASDQVHVDVAQEELISVVNVMNGFAGFFVALFANCPIFNGPNEFKAYRELIWDDLGKDRTGLPRDPIQSVEDYLERTWEMNCIIAIKDNKYFCPNVKFRDYIEGMDDEELMEAFKIHEGTIWFCARPRLYGTVEMRPAGLQPWEDMVAVPALTMGLLANLGESEMFLKQFRWDMLKALRYEAVEKGFDIVLEGKPISEFVKEILNIAKKGLENRGMNEEKYLNALFKRVKEEMSPADTSREILKHGGMDLMLEKNTLKKEQLKI